MVHERRKSIKLKSLFRTQHDSGDMNRKGLLKISSPVLQHSTSIYSLVSPIKTSFSINDRHTPSPLSASPLSVSSHSVSPLSQPRHEKAQRAMTFDESCIKTMTKTRRHSCSTVIFDENLPQTSKSIPANKMRDRQRSHSKGPSPAASVGTIQPSSSKSTPLQHKIKTYNVNKRKMSVEELEKQRKAKELEDLITGRRKSTLKLTLTPKGL